MVYFYTLYFVVSEIARSNPLLERIVSFDVTNSGVRRRHAQLLHIVCELSCLIMQFCAQQSYFRRLIIVNILVDVVLNRYSIESWIINSINTINALHYKNWLLQNSKRFT